MADFSPSLNDVKIKSPTEDGKLAYLANTMVPRRLDQFDDIRRDLANRDFNTDKAFFYVNFQAGDFCGRSYKLPLSELNEFISDSLLFGTSGKDPAIGFDNNFFIDDNNEIHLIIKDVDFISDKDLREKIREKVASDPKSLYFIINDLATKNNEQDMNIFTEVDNRILGDVALEEKKQDKFVIFGSGDNVTYDADGNAIVTPKADEENDAFGVHVDYHPIDSEGHDVHGPKIGEDPNTGEFIWGPAIKIDHDYRFAQTITSKFDIGGIGKGQTILKGTPLETFLWQLLRGDPVIENIIYWKPSDVLPVVPTSGDISPTTWTDLGPWGHNHTTTNDDLLSTPVADPTLPYQWKGVLSLGNLIMNDQYLLLSVPRSNSTGFKPDDQGQWVVPLLNSEKAPHGIELNEIYLKDAPEFKYQFKTLKLFNEESSTEWGYVIYYIDLKTYYPAGDQTWVAEFVPRA